MRLALWILAGASLRIGRRLTFGGCRPERRPQERSRPARSARRRKRAAGGRHHGAALVCLAGRPRDVAASAEGRRQPERGESLWHDGAVAGLHQRQRSDGGTAAPGRRGSERRAPGRRNAVDDRVADGQSGGCTRAAGEGRERGSEGSARPDRHRVGRRALPVRDAVIRGVSPPGSAAFGSAPASSSSSTMAPFPLVQASEAASRRSDWRVDARAGLQQKPRGLRSSWYDRPVQRRRAASAARLHRRADRADRERLLRSSFCAASASRRVGSRCRQRCACQDPTVRFAWSATGSAAPPVPAPLPVLSANESSAHADPVQQRQVRFASGVGSGYFGCGVRPSCAARRPR